VQTKCYLDEATVDLSDADNISHKFEMSPLRYFSLYATYVHLMGIHFIGIHLIGVYLTGVYLISIIS